MSASIYKKPDGSLHDLDSSYEKEVHTLIMRVKLGNKPHLDVPEAPSPEVLKIFAGLLRLLPSIKRVFSFYYLGKEGTGLLSQSLRQLIRLSIILHGYSTVLIEYLSNALFQLFQE